MPNEELDLGPIEQNLKDVDGFPRGIGGVTDGLYNNQVKLIAEVKRLRRITQQTEMADDIIYKNYKRLMAQLPQCPEHGECVPYAIDWLKDLKTKNPGRVDQGSL